MALAFLDAGLPLRSASGAGRLVVNVVPVRVLLLVPILRSTGANGAWSEPLGAAGKDSAEMGEPRLKRLSKHALSCSLLTGRVGLYMDR